jgi:biopolymer transport protein ExbB/biopolymer transport protein TolQ
MQKLVLVASTGATVVLYLLLALSVFSVGVVIERWLYFRRRKFDLATVGDSVAKKLRAHDLKGARKELADLRAVEAEVIGDALAYYDDGPDSLGEIVQKGIRQRRKIFESGLLFLGTLGSNSPFVGLFGTVLGVVAAFKELGAASANVAAASGGGMGNVMGGIAEALIATAVGILVAIPAVIAYNLFQKKCNDIEENTGALANQVLAVMKAKPGNTNKAASKGGNKQLTPMDDVDESSNRSLRPAEVNS